jgi:hypothetical protein
VGNMALSLKTYPTAHQKADASDPAISSITNCDQQSLSVRTLAVIDGLKQSKPFP